MKRFTLVASLILFAGVFAGCSKQPSSNATPGPTPRVKKVDKNINAEPIEKRPFVVLSPRGDGKAVTVSIRETKQGYKEGEYEIEYNSGSLVQGAFGQLTLADGKAEKEVLLGSCSTGGKCTYNPDVTGGTLILRFTSPDSVLKQEWSYGEAKKTENVYPSRDGKLVVDLTKSKVKPGFVLIYNSPGYPGSLEGQVLSGPYTVTANTALSGDINITARVSSDVTTARLMGWDGKAWKELSKSIKNGQLTFLGPVFTAYVVVK